MGEDGLIRKGFGLRKRVAPEMARDYHSELVQRARENGFRLEWPGFTVLIAKEFGFCYGVERAINCAYEARLQFPDRRLFITGEIIHNPGVNRRLKELGYEFLDGAHGSVASISELSSQDVVLIPAFGVPMPMLQELREVGCVLVDTTCGSVLNVWRNVENYAKSGFSCLIHGKWNHEETRATVSRAMLHPEGRYLVVLNLEEARFLTEFIEGRGRRDRFLDYFRSAMSPGFDPDRHLERIGMANQTTMLASESQAIAEKVRAAMARRYGAESVAERFRSFETICSATQDRQDAVRDLLNERPDLILILGGFNSSNTGHLAELVAPLLPTFHVEDADCLLDARRIRHKPVGKKEALESEGWFPEGPVRIGLAAGASTPDREIGRLIARLLELRGLPAGEI